MQVFLVFQYYCGIFFENVLSNSYWVCIEILKFFMLFILVYIASQQGLHHTFLKLFLWMFRCVYFHVMQFLVNWYLQLGANLSFYSVLNLPFWYVFFNFFELNLQNTYLTMLNLVNYRWINQQANVHWIIPSYPWKSCNNVDAIEFDVIISNRMWIWKTCKFHSQTQNISEFTWCRCVFYLIQFFSL